jgi:hypothetical protein
MPRLHGWTAFWTYGGSYFVATMWGPSTNEPAPHDTEFEVRIWPMLGDAASNDPTTPLGPDRGGMVFPTEAAARAYVESWERAVAQKATP